MRQPEGAPQIDGASDAELIASVRGGDLAAFGVLFERHRDAAQRLARSLVSGPDADDLVSDAFSKVLGVLQNGGGPDLAFRAYLLTAVRRLHVDRYRVLARATPVADFEPLDKGEEHPDVVVAGFENAAAARAFRSLPERWQMVLWHTEVEQMKPADIAPLLGISANSVSALAYRAREGLRQAFLQMHAGDIADETCVKTRELLGGYVRSGLSHRDSQAVRDHLDTCRRCTAVYLELTEVNSSMAALLAPIVLGGAAAAYLGTVATAGAATAAGATGLGALVGRVRDSVSSNGPAAAVAGVVVAAAAVGGAFALTNSGSSPHQAAVSGHTGSTNSGSGAGAGTSAQNAPVSVAPPVAPVVAAPPPALSSVLRPASTTPAPVSAAPPVSPAPTTTPAAPTTTSSSPPPTTSPSPPPTTTQPGQRKGQVGPPKAPAGCPNVQVTAGAPVLVAGLPCSIVPTFLAPFLPPLTITLGPTGQNAQ